MAKPLPMHQIKRIIEWQFQGKSFRKIARLSNLSRDTISKYVQRIKDSGMATNEMLALDNKALSSLMYTESIARLRQGFGGRGRTQNNPGHKRTLSALARRRSPKSNHSKSFKSVLRIARLRQGFGGRGRTQNNPGHKRTLSAVARRRSPEVKSFEQF